MVDRATTTFAICASLSCGTIASPSHGDVDLPTSLLGPFRPLRAVEGPGGVGFDIQPNNGVAFLDEPGVLVREDAQRRQTRSVYMSWIDGNDRFIARAGPAMPAMRPAGATADNPLAIEGYARVVLRPQFDWQRGGVSSPGVALDGTRVVMVYAAGGAIGFASSDDGVTFTANATPMLQPLMDPASGGESDSLGEPSIARAPTNQWFLTYSSGGRIFLARAPRPDGPWERVDATPGDGRRDPIVAPAPDAPPLDAGVSMDAGMGGPPRAFGDPALTILTTPTGRTSYRVFFTVLGADPATSVGAAATWDITCPGATAANPCFRRIESPVYAVSRNNLRAGAFDRVSQRIALLWVGAGTGRPRSISVGIAPADLDPAPWVARGD